MKRQQHDHWQLDRVLSEFDQMSTIDQLRAVNKSQIEWLMVNAAEAPSKYALDLGFGCGISAIAMSLGGCSVTSINYEDVNVPRRVEAEKRYKRICGQEPNIVNAATDRALPRLLDDERSFGLIFVDAGHRFDDVFIDVHYAARLCVPGGILALDDTYYAAIRIVANWVLTNLAHIWRPYNILENTISWKRTEADLEDSAQGLAHRSHEGPPISFEVATENKDEFMYYPGEGEAERYGFETWRPGPGWLSPKSPGE